MRREGLPAISPSCRELQRSANWGGYFFLSAPNTFLVLSPRQADAAGKRSDIDSENLIQSAPDPRSGVCGRQGDPRSSFFFFFGDDRRSTSSIWFWFCAVERLR
jgi:hypothetical protein